MAKNAMRRAAASLLAVLLALPPGDPSFAAADGTIEGVVRLGGRPLAGVTVAFIELQTGNVVRATSREDGTFRTAAEAGDYAVTTESRAGLTIGQAPVRVSVTEGGAATADVELVAVASAVLEGTTPAVQEPPAEPLPAAEGQPPEGPVWAETSGPGAAIRFEPVTCFVAGEFPLLDAAIEPIASVARARVYFRGAAGGEYYYVEMTQETGRYFGKLPRPRVEASPITYYLQSTTTEFEESQTREIDAIVVADRSECGDRKVAAFGPPGPITVFSASSGAIATPAGFAAAATGIVAGLVAVIAAGAAAAGIVGGVVVGPGPGASASPPPINPSPIPVPTPQPQPTPTPITTFR